MAVASGSQRTLDGCWPNQAKRSRMSYTREYKLGVVEAYQGTNLYQTAKRFSLNTKTIGRYVADVESPVLVIVLISAWFSQSRSSHLTVYFLARSLVSFPDPALLTEIDVRLC